MSDKHAEVLRRARRLAESGNLKAARSAYRQLMSKGRIDGRLLLECAIVEASAGFLAAARRHLELALKHLPDDADVHFNLAEVERSDGRLDAAIRHYRIARALIPDDGDVCFGLGEALREGGRPDEALEAIEAAARLAPQDAVVRNALGLVRESLSMEAEAIAAYGSAVEIEPGYRDAWCNLGLTAQRAGMYEDAAAAFDRAWALSGEPLPLILLPWARSLLFSRRFDEALRRIDDAIALGDDPALAPLTRGQIAQQLGDFDAAEASFRAALLINPGLGIAYEALSRMKRLGDDRIPDLRAVIGNDEIAAGSRAAAGFALYTILDRADETDAAFAALVEANRLKAQEHSFVADRHAEFCERTIAAFDRRFLEQRAQQGHDSAAPIFIVGMPRSGTTLTEQILAFYPEVAACGERQDMKLLAGRIDGYPEGIRALPADWARPQAGDILSKMLPRGSTARFATNKLPGNYAFIGLIAILFPRARIVYCRRDPRDIGFSSLEQNFRSGLSFTYDQLAFVEAYRQHLRLMRHWFEVSPIPIHTLCYEELASDPEATARLMIEYCGLEWRPGALNTHEVSRPIETASLWQVRQPINTGSLGKWKRYERHLQPMIEALGTVAE